MYRYSCHGDHIDSVIDTKVFLHHHLRDIFYNSKGLYKVNTLVVSDIVNNEETELDVLEYGDGDIHFRSLFVQGTTDDKYEFITCFPYMKSTAPINAKIIKVEEWGNKIEATITCEIDGMSNITFFATDYSWNKKSYIVGNRFLFEFSALAYRVDEVSNRNQGKETVFFQTDNQYPEDVQFQSPVSNINYHEIRGVRMTSCNIKVSQNSDKGIVLYFRSDKKPDIVDGMVINGLLWLQGKISEEQLTYQDVLSLGKKGKEFVSSIKKATNNADGYKTTDNLNWCFNILDKLSIAKGKVIDTFEYGDSLNSVFDLYIHREQANTEYYPDDNRQIIAPFRDDMYIARKISYKAFEQLPLIWSYITVPFTPMGIWQAFLLKNSTDFMPKWWHRNKKSKEIVMDIGDIGSLIKLYGDEFTEDNLRYLSKGIETRELLPFVDMDGDKAYVECAFWSKTWGGLWRMETPVFKANNSVQWGIDSFEQEIKLDRSSII